jgi:hypothetical protein
MPTRKLVTLLLICLWLLSILPGSWWESKQSRNRAGVAQRVPGGLGSQISWHSTRESGEVVSLTHRPPLSPGIFLVLIFTTGWVDPRAMVRSEGNMSLKNPVTPPETDPGTVRLVVQRLSHYANPGERVVCLLLDNDFFLYTFFRLYCHQTLYNLSCWQRCYVISN